MKNWKLWLIGLLVPTMLFAGVVYYGSGEAVFLVDQIKMNLGFTTSYTADEAHLQGTVKAENFKGGINNLIANGGFELSADGWVKYKDAAGDKPVDGTGGTSTLTLLHNTAGTHLDGVADLFVTVPASNVQGEGFSYDFDLTGNGYKANNLTISFMYTTSSNDIIFRVYIVDKDTGAVIEPVPTEILPATNKPWTGTFQAAASSDSYRLVVHVASTSTSGSSMTFDNFFVGPQEIAVGPILKIQSLNFTEAGSSLADLALEIRFSSALDDDDFVGDSVLEIEDDTSNTRTKFVALEDCTVTVSVSGQTDADNRFFKVFKNGATISVGTGRSASDESSLSAASVELEVGEYITVGTNTNVRNSGALVYLNMIATSKSYTQISTTDAGARDISVSASGNAGTTLTSNVTPIDFANETIDNSSSWSGDTFVLPESGRYALSGMAYYTAAAPNTYLWVKVVGGIFVQKEIISLAQSALYTQHFDIEYSGSKGDELQIRISGTKTLSNSSQEHYISIHKVQSPQQMAASEKVTEVFYENSGGGSIGTSATAIIYADKTSSTHSAYNSTTGEFTAPRSGRVKVNAALFTATMTLATTQRIYLEVWKDNGSGFAVNRALDRIIGSGNTASYNPNGYAVIPVNKGDKLKIYSASHVATTVSGNFTLNHVSFEMD